VELRENVKNQSVFKTTTILT